MPGPKIHCLGVGEHRDRPLCGECRNLPAVSRQEFMNVNKENRCGRCADAAWIRGELRWQDKHKISVTGGAAAGPGLAGPELPAVLDIK
jgi:hypothetical protein